MGCGPTSQYADGGQGPSSVRAKVLALRRGAVAPNMRDRKNAVLELSMRAEVTGTPGRSEVRRSLDRLYSAAYEELRRLASSVRRSFPAVTLSPTTLVNEAWEKLARSPIVGATSRLHFKRIAARAMRQVLVDAARRRNAWKRGGRDVAF